MLSPPVRILLALLLIGCSHEHAPPMAPPADRALAEFAGAYPADPSPTGVVRTYDLTAEPIDLPLLDGRKLSVWAYNGQVPGPTLRVKLGETVRVHFTNKLPQDTTIHWHGVRVPNGMDGVPSVTQPPIPPGGSFTYEFTPKDAGTFWYHPHLRASEQVERGLYGMFIVEDATPPPFTSEATWILDDWRLDAATGQIDPEFNARHDLMMDGRWGMDVTVNGHSHETLRVRPGERVRVRILDAANGRVFLPDFGQLDAKIIAVDGMYLREPIPAAGFELAPGNRLDIDLTATRSETVRDRFIASRPNDLVEVIVDGAPVDTPRFASPAHAQIPRWKDALAVPVTHEFHLNAQQGGPFGIAWTIDGVAFDASSMMSMDMPDALTLHRGRFHHLRFVNDSPRIHPIHLHGMFFRLLARNDQPVDEPFFRDTVLIHARETVDVGVVPMDAGRWMMHCHILEHAEAGMMTTLRVAE
jgi:FtsP/CotA-like multicopper oxidase with cupredoxin domain